VGRSSSSASAAESDFSASDGLAMLIGSDIAVQLIGGL